MENANLWDIGAWCALVCLDPWGYEASIKQHLTKNGNHNKAGKRQTKAHKARQTSVERNAFTRPLPVASSFRQPPPQLGRLSVHFPDPRTHWCSRSGSLESTKTHQKTQNRLFSTTHTHICKRAKNKDHKSMNIEKSYFVTVATHEIIPFDDSFLMALKNPSFVVYRWSLLNVHGVGSCLHTNPFKG